MHELSIAMNILEIAEAESRRHAGARVHAIHVKLGVLSGVVEVALLSAFELARADSPFSQARLIIESDPVRMFCPVCSTNQPVVSIQKMCCTVCGTPATKVVSGQDMEIIAMEIDDLQPGSSEVHNH